MQYIQTLGEFATIFVPLLTAASCYLGICSIEAFQRRSSDAGKATYSKKTEKVVQTPFAQAKTTLKHFMACKGKLTT